MPETILEEADRLINGDRQDTYGPVSESFGRIAELWSAYLGIPLFAKTVADLMILLKLSRTRDTYHRDSYVDLAGYAALVERLQEEAVVEAEVVPRVWSDLGSVPRNVKVVDSAGDLIVFNAEASMWQGFDSNIYGNHSYSEDYGPFTEVLT